MKLLRSPDEVNTIRIETLEPRQPTTVSKYSPVTSSMEDDEEEEEDSGMDEMMSLRPCQVSDITYQHREQVSPPAFRRPSTKKLYNRMSI